MFDWLTLEWLMTNLEWIVTGMFVTLGILLLFPILITFEFRKFLQCMPIEVPFAVPIGGLGVF